MTGVTTAKDVVEGRLVVDAAGAWTRQVAEASGIRVPLAPTRHQLIVTEPLEDAQANLPMVRIMDAAVYMRPCQGGLLWGVFEEAPHFFDMQSLGANFDIKNTPLDIEVLRSAAAEVKDQLPILQTAQVQEFRGGIPTMTADGHHILGPAPGVRRFLLRQRLQCSRAFNLADGGRGARSMDRRWQPTSRPVADVLHTLQRQVVD